MSKKLMTVASFCGSVFSPILSFFAPIILKYMYYWTRDLKTSTKESTIDGLYFLFAMVISYMGVTY